MRLFDCPTSGPSGTVGSFRYSGSMKGTSVSRKGARNGGSRSWGRSGALGSACRSGLKSSHLR